MATTIALFKSRFPEFDSVAEDRIQLFLDDAEAVMDSATWSNLFDAGQAYLAAHYLALATKSAVGSTAASSGAVISRSVDGVSVSYGGASSTSHNAGYYSATAYGQRYFTMLKNLGIAASVI